MYGISVEDAMARLERQPRVGQLAARFAGDGPPSYGGLYIDQHPQYRVVLLAIPGHGREVESAVDDLGFAELSRFVSVRETPFTEKVLRASARRVGLLFGGRVTTSDIDIRAGDVLVTVATSRDVDPVESGVAETMPKIKARRVIVTVGQFVEEHSYGRLILSTCTSGFSVRRTTDGDTGVSTAAHCQNAQTLQKHATPLDFVTEKIGDSQDVQWHKTPGLDDPNLINDRDSNGISRSITARVDRSEMPMGGNVCHSGKTSGYGCGEIAGKTFDPDASGSAFNDTFIRVREDDTQGGDSGGPWFLANAAYGTHRGSTDNMADDPIFMAQNYMSALNLEVRINP